MLFLIVSFSGLSHETIAPEDDMRTFVASELRESYSRIRKIEVVKFCDADVDCKSVSVGTNACGDPNPQISYSVKTDIVSENEITYYAQRITFLEEMELMGMTADCYIEGQPLEKRPVVNCVSNICESSKELYR